ncbi:MAG: molybdopterin molybdotransferase MoeA [Planctomycetes bacterium]|nr:molybdopterin molybdotransferase MoeA [Planctomycetota bacterium]
MSQSSKPHPNADVRMRGFVERVTVENALAWLDNQLDSAPALSAEIAPLGESAGRVLAEDIRSQVNVPDFERAMMDGFAVRSADLQGASAEAPVTLKVIGECFPGQIFDGAISAGCAVRIMTGAPLPTGVDAVLPVEKTKYSETEVHALAELSPGKNFGSVGEDIQVGDIVLSAGRVLRPQDIGVLSSIGQGEVSVLRRPRVRIVVTGDELLPAGSLPEGCQIVDANGPMLSALVARDGGEPNHPGIVPDNRDAILAALREDADVILCSGGSSVGQEDHVPTLLAEHGELEIHGIAMRPAGPLGMGRIDGRLVVLLPGNPVACLWGYDLFASRAVRRLAGRPTDWPYRQIEGELTKEITSPVGRLDYIRVHMKRGQVEPVQATGASVLSSTTRAEGFIIIPTDSSGYSTGSIVNVFLYD